MESRLHELVRSACEGDAEAAAELIGLTYARVYAFLRRLAGHDADAADLTQRTYQRAWGTLGNFAGRCSFASWLHGIAWRTYEDWLRSPRRMEPANDAWWEACPAPEAAPDAQAAAHQRPGHHWWRGGPGSGHIQRDTRSAGRRGGLRASAGDTMNPRRLLLLCAVLTVAGAAWSWTLRGERAALEHESAALRAAVPAAATPVPQPEPPRPLTRAEQDELLELRGRLAELLRRQRELAARPAAVTPAARRTPAQGAELRRRLGLPPDYRLATELTVEGYATPAAALASLIAGARARDTNAVLAALVPPMAEQLAQAIQSQGVDILGENFGATPGFRVLSEEADRGGRGVLEVEMMPGLPPMKFRAVRDEDGNWRLDPWGE